MKKIKYILILIILVSFNKVVYANDIKKITMDIYIDNYGNAHIKEVWDAYLNTGTEGYKPYYNLGDAKISNFKVSLNNKYFTTLNNWDIDASFDEKSYKAGLNEIDDGYELCFGISKYGNNSYKMEYTIENFVVGLNDADMVYWQLIPYDLSDKPEYVYVKIYSDFNYSNDLPVWGYGNYGGYAYVYDGYIEVSNDNGIDSDEYIVVLIKYPKNTFNLSTHIDNDFDYYYDLAEDGAVTYAEDKFSFGDFLYLIAQVFMIIVTAFIVIASTRNSEYGTKNLKFSKGSKNLKDAQYFRDIPCNKDIHKAYWVSCQYGLTKNKTDFLGAILLKWLKNKNVENVVVTTKITKKEEKALKLISSDNLPELEKELFDMMLKASVDGILESNEFKKWCQKNYNKILKWFNKVIDNVTMEYVNIGLIKEEKKLFSTNYIVNDSLKDEALKLAGLKKFLLEFSVIHEREAIEVNLWEEYLMYAQIFGIAMKVAKEFKKLYPDVITDATYDDIIFIHAISYNGVSAATTARDRARSYSSGGGGFSSGGGGGGSFGGGGGGGGFR